MAHEHTIGRREAMATLSLGALGASAAMGTGLDHHRRAGSTHDLGSVSDGSLSEGYNEAQGEYVLPPLPYAYDALEPHIDKATMRIHHSRHHAGYVRRMNQCLAELQAIREGQGEPGLVEYWSRELTFAAGGHANHTLFWRCMSPAGGGAPAGELAETIERDFGSYERFVAHFQQAARSVEASGWGWLVHEPMADKLMVVQMGSQQNWMLPGSTPLLGIDVWEHAYYLKYQNRRADYVAAFMNVIDWGFVAARLRHARR